MCRAPIERFVPNQHSIEMYVADCRQCDWSCAIFQAHAYIAVQEAETVPHEEGQKSRTSTGPQCKVWLFVRAHQLFSSNTSPTLTPPDVIGRPILFLIRGVFSSQLNVKSNTEALANGCLWDKRNRLSMEWMTRSLPIWRD